MIKDRHTMRYLRTQIAMIAVLACLNVDSAIAEGPAALSAAADQVVQEYLEKVHGALEPWRSRSTGKGRSITSASHASGRTATTMRSPTA
jgi:hypothetical protein